MLVTIYHIQNYATKGDNSQDQTVITMVIGRKTFDDHDKDCITGFSNYSITLDKFA